MNPIAQTISPPASPPKALLPWLSAVGSITQMAKACCESVKLKLLDTRWGPTREYHREILMLCDDRPWWYAHTRMPQATFDKKAALFNELGENSLGCLLFSDPTIRRQSLRYYEVGQGEVAYQKAAQFVSLQGERLWARESIYLISGLPLYLLEVFLPDMLDIIC